MKNIIFESLIKILVFAAIFLLFNWLATKVFYPSDMSTYCFGWFAGFLASAIGDACFGD